MGTLADKLAYLSATKTAIKNAITAKGVDVDNAVTFRQYADKIGEIEGGEQLGIYPIGADSRPTGDVVVPEGVTSLHQYVFCLNTAVTSIALPYGIITLGVSCCVGCVNLIFVVLPETLTAMIGQRHFWDCKNLATVDCRTLKCAFSSNSFCNCNALTNFITYPNFNPTALSLSYSPLLSVDSMVAMFNNLVTLSTAKTITLGSTNLEKLTTAQKQIATDKNWVLA